MPFDIQSPAFPLDPQALARQIDIPLKDWPLNCHGIASAVQDLVPVLGMRLVRGHYSGPVSSRSAYSGRIQQHSWLELEDGRILDPTRWAMDCPERPYIYLGLSDFYDEAARALSQALPPPFPGREPDFNKALSGLAPADLRRLAEVLQTSSGRLSEAIFYALRRDPEELADAAGFYGLLDKAGLKALVPIDCWRKVMEPDLLICRPDANRHFVLPSRESISPRDLIGRLLNRFVCVEERPELEWELEEFDCPLGLYYDALNRLIDRPGIPIKYFSYEEQYALGIALSEFLGEGFGNVLMVERYAKSCGFSKTEFAGAYKEVTGELGLAIGWD